MDDLEKTVLVRPSWDYRYSSKLEERRHGAHGAELVFLVSGPMGVVTFDIFTHWMVQPLVEPYRQSGGLEENPRRKSRVGYDAGVVSGPYPNLVGLHSIYPSPNPEQLQTRRTNCPYTKGDCYAESLGLSAADNLFSLLVGEGSNALFDALTEHYGYLNSKDV